jgi:cytochrome c-type biogenesis protein CcmE
MKTRAIVALVLTLAGLAAMVGAFLVNASPYVTIAEAKASRGNNLHLAGDLDKSTIRTVVSKQEVHFDLRDEKGEVVKVVYHGPAPANLGEATKVVAVGGMKEGAFHASKLLVKCPSKYESSKVTPS